MKHPVLSPSRQATPNTRRKFLQLAALPVSSFLLTTPGGAASAHASPAATVPLPDWVTNLALWQWHEIPGTALATVNPATRALGVTGPSSKIIAWCGACLKRSGSVYMLGAAGGHADYAGNEVDALALNVATPRWTQLRGPTPNADIINDTQFYLDHRPSFTHTYYSTQFIENLNRMMVFSSPGISGDIFPPAPANFPYKSDKADRRSFSFDLATGDWDPPDYVAQFPGTGGQYANLCVKHPMTSDVYYSKSGGAWYRWASATNTWTQLSGATRNTWFAGAAIDPRRNRMLIVGSYSPIAPEVRTLDGARVPADFTGLGASALALAGYPAVIYDEAIDRYLVAFNSGPSIKILRVHPETWLVDDPAVGGMAPAARRNGLQNAMQYVPELRGFVLANKYDGNVFFVRTAT